MKILKSILLALGLSISTISFGQDGYLDKQWEQLSDTTFDRLVSDNKLIFTMPEGFIVTRIKKNDNVYYQYAIKDKKSNFEVRIFIRSFKNQNVKADFDLNKYSYNFTTVMALNASGGTFKDMPQVDLLPEDAVQHDFNADWGGISSFKPSTPFGKGFNFCSLFCYRLNDVAEVYLFYMFNNVSKQQDLLEKSFLVMKFKDK